MKNPKYVEELSSKLVEKLSHIRTQAIIKKLAEENNIELIKDNSVEYIRGCSIKQGSLIISKFGNPKYNYIILHELCHIMVCDPEYRHLMNINTVKSYADINDIKFSKYHNEKATLVLQHLIHRKYNIDPFMSNVNLSKDRLESKDIFITLGSEHFSRPKWVDDYYDIVDHVNLDFEFPNISQIQNATCDEFFDGDLYYGLVHKTKNRDYTLKKFKYDSGHWRDSTNSKIVKSTEISVVSMAAF